LPARVLAPSPSLSHPQSLPPSLPPSIHPSIHIYFILHSSQIGFIDKLTSLFCFNIKLKNFIKNIQNDLICFQESLGFTVNVDVRLSGCSPELIHNLLSKLAVMGTDYVHLVRFINKESQSGGLVLQAFLGGLRNYLQCYRATILSVNGRNIH
jgi:hypothetical protein